MTDNSCDLVVVGAGIVGLASAYAAARTGRRVTVVERNASAAGASIRNFGFVTVTGQRRGEHWQRAMQSRAVWEEVAKAAHISVVHRGLHVHARRPQAAAVLHAFLQTEMGQECRLLSRTEIASDLPYLAPTDTVMYSPHECRVESRDALPQLAQWLQERWNVQFLWGTAVHQIELPRVHTSRGTLHAPHCVVCPGHDLYTLYPDWIAQANIRLCTLQMLRVQPSHALQLNASVMSDLSLVRYEGYSALPEAADLRLQLEQEQGHHLTEGVHLIAVQSADGSLVVGDSHVYGDSEMPFARESVDQLILQELDTVMPMPGRRVTERWVGTYASAQDVVFKASPQTGVAIGLVTGGTGASTSFAFGQELWNLARGV